MITVFLSNSDVSADFWWLSIVAAAVLVVFLVMIVIVLKRKRTRTKGEDVFSRTRN